MKRTPLQRRTPLARSSSLSPGTRRPRPAGIEPPARGWDASRPRAGRLAGTRPAAANPIPSAVRARVLERDGLCCVRCGVSVASGPRSIHHRRPRGMGGTRRPEVHRLSLLVLVCGTGTTGCHGAIESYRAAAAKGGFLVSQFEPADPQLVPLFPLAPEIVWLSDDGTKTVQPLF